jgi:hypothetical protein
MLRHARGFFLADEGTDTRLIQDYLGHRDIKSRVIRPASVGCPLFGSASVCRDGRSGPDRKDLTGLNAHVAESKSDTAIGLRVHKQSA